MPPRPSRRRDAALGAALGALAVLAAQRLAAARRSPDQGSGSGGESSGGAAADAAEAIAANIDAVIQRLAQSTSAVDERVKLFASLIESRRAALDAAGVASSAALEAGLLADKAAGAKARLALAEERWKQELGKLEAAANSATQVPLKIGDRAPDFKLLEASGSTVSLGDLLSQGASSVLLVFLRHFG